MGKRIFWIFFFFVSGVIGLTLSFIHSENFAAILKKQIATHFSERAGLKIEFDHVSVGILPPSLSLINVDVRVLQENNPLHLKKESAFHADKIGFSFQMIQAFSRGIAVNEVFLSGANVHLELPDTGEEKSKSPLRLDELAHKNLVFSVSKNFSVSIRQIEINESKVYVAWVENAVKNFVDIEQVHYLAFTPDSRDTNIVLNLEQANLSIGRLKQSLTALKINTDLKKDSISISSLDLQRMKAVLHGSGSAHGSLDHLENLKLDLNLIVRGSSSDVADLESSLQNFDFQFSSELKMQGTPEHPILRGRTEVTKFHYSMWDFDKIIGEIDYANKNLSVEQLAIEKSGGKIELLGKTQLSLPVGPLDQNLSLRLTRVSIPDFAGDLKLSINNLRGIVDGEVPAHVQLGKTGGQLKLLLLELNPKLTINNFELNNQGYGKKRPYKKIFGLRKFTGDASLTVKNKALTINRGTLLFESGKLDVSGGVSSEGEYNIIGNTPNIDFGAEVGAVANIPLSGNGSLALHVRGPGRKVQIDFDIDQKNAKFVNFDFGSLTGRATYDDDKNYIYISKLHGNKNQSGYDVSGAVNVGDGDDINLTAKFTDANPDDLFTVFSKQLSKLTWIPHGMTGQVSADVKVGGGYDKSLESLIIDASVKTKKLSYKGESISEAKFDAGVHKGTIFAKNLVAKKYSSDLTGYINYFPNGELEYAIDAPKGKLRNLDHVAFLGLPLDGTVSLKSSGKGTWEKLKSSTVVSITNFFVRTRSIPNFRMEFNTEDEKDSLKASLGGQDLSVELALNKEPKTTSVLQFHAHESNLEYVLCLINRSTCGDDSANLLIDGDAKFNWVGTKWEEMDGGGQIRKIFLEKNDFSVRNSSPASLSATNGLLNFSPLQLKGEGTQLVLAGSGKVDGSSLQWSAKGATSLRILEFVNALIEEGKGVLNIDLGASGSSENAKFAGSIEIKNGFLRFTGLDAPVDNLQGRIHFDGSRATVSSMTSMLGGGTGTVSGYVDIFLNRPPHFNLDLFLTNNRLKFFPVNYVEFDEARLGFTGDAPPYLFGGTAKVRSVMMRNNFGVGGQKSIQNARYLPEKVGGALGFYEIKIRAIAEGGVFVQNDLLDAEFKGELTLLNNFEFPQIVARGELVKGKLLFRSTPFILDHAYISVPTPGYFNPQFSLGGVADVDVYHINLFASGTAEAPKITFSSSPPLAQEDIISLLAFGFKGEDNKSKISATNTSAITYSEMGSILLEQLRLSQDLQSKGVKLTVAPSVTQSQSNIIHPNSNPDVVSPKVYLQTQLLKKVDATFGSTLGTSESQELNASLQYKISNHSSLSAVYEEEPTDIDATERIRSYGADVKFRWGFK